MLKFVILFCGVTSALGAAVSKDLLPQLDGRIVGGAATRISNFPWHVSVQRYGSPECSGSIYNEKIIVTAAHCLVNISTSALKVRAGSSHWNSGGILVGVSAFKYHEGYDFETDANDIGVVRLSSSLPLLSSTIKPIALATTAPPNGAAAKVSGWGDTAFGTDFSPSQLRYVDVEIVSRDQCAFNYGYNATAIKDGMICTYSRLKGSCHGDSGGPLVSGGLLVGVVSWGKGCAYPNFPSVYADVAAFHDWIVNTAESI